MTEVTAIAGLNQYLFLSGDTNSALDQLTGRRLLSAADLDHWLLDLQQRKQFLDSLGIQTTFLIAPNKESVYYDHLIDYLPGKVRPVHQLETILERVNYPYLWPIGALQVAREIMPTYPTIDTHWNDFGALIAANIALVQIGLPEIPLSECSFEPQIWQGDLGSKMSPVQTGVFLRGSHRGQRLEPAFDNQVVHGGHMMVFANAHLASGKLLVFGDSFGESLCRWLGRRFASVIFCHTTGFDQQLIVREKPDFVIWQMVERFLIAPPARMSGFDFTKLMASKLTSLTLVQRQDLIERTSPSINDQTVQRLAGEFREVLLKT